MPHNPRAFSFDGGAFSYFATQLGAALIVILTLGLAAPWAICLRESWRCEHTSYAGKRLRFTGSGFGLLGLWLKWFLFLILTLGIYSFWLIPDLERWKAEHTEFDGSRPA
jgi:uncharacterized membrane protein YjgN (DUF898 family)